MPFDFSETREALVQLQTDGTQFFLDTLGMSEADRASWEGSPNEYWSQLSTDQQSQSFVLQSRLLEVIRPIANSIKLSALTSDADRRDLVIWTRTARAALRLRRYDFSEADAIHDEGVVLGYHPETQSEDYPLHPTKAVNTFAEPLQRILEIIDYIEIAPELPTTQWLANPQADASFETNTAFVMMAFDPNEPSLEDTYQTIKRCFDTFNITAIRADKIEHEGVITDEIRKRIRTSEFLLADMTLERPNVYYEVGYAHAIDRRVILYRKEGTRLHFDLSVHNCPEYSNLTGLEEMLLKRLEHMTGRSREQREE